jgi:hypothetical protein
MRRTIVASLPMTRLRVERDRLTAELADVSPAVIQLADLMARIVASDREMAQVNSALPLGAEHLRSAVVGASPAFAHLFEERSCAMSSSATDRFQPKPVTVFGYLFR